jgi:probable HAF family extracellular repeat protein
MVRSILGVLAIVMLAVAVPVSAEPVDAGYDIVILEHLAGAGRSRAADINERGQVVGSSVHPGVPHAVLWESGNVIDLGTAGGSGAHASAVNNRGQVAAHATTGLGDIAFKWERGESRVLDSLGIFPSGGYDNRVRDVNDRGAAVGNSRDSDRKGWAVLWGTDLTVVRLDGLVPDATRAYAINNQNQVVGITDSEWNRGASQAFLWDDGVVTRLSTPQGRQSIATDVNQRGQAVGFSQVADEPIRFHAVLWDTDGSVIDLGTLGGSSSEAYGINDRGQVVGYSLLPAGSPGCPPTLECRRAFLWDQGEMIDLGTLTFGSQASDINNRGEVVGWSSANEDGFPVEYAVKWVPSSGGG